MVQQEVSSEKLIKSSAWYTVSSFLLKGLGFITIPFFSRMMTKSEMGDYSNFLVWLSLFNIVFGMSLETSINRARLDFSEDLDQYCSSILLFGTGLAITSFAFYSILPIGIKRTIGLNTLYFFLIVLYIIFNHSYSITLARQRIIFEYKKTVFLSMTYSIISVMSSLLLVFFMKDKYLGRSLGYVLPLVVYGLPLYLHIINKGRAFAWRYIKYAIAFCWPFIPHSLALNILGASDRIMITNMIGNEATATYSIANNCVMIASLFFVSLNTAMSPWVFDHLHSGNTRVLKKITFPYVMIFLVCVEIIQLIAPEILLIVGGEKYLEAKDCFLPLFTGVVVQFCYSLYVNIEQFSRKTWAIAGGTAIAAIVNVALNFILIPRYGYVVAAYTTLIGYLVLFAVHYTFVRIIGYRNVYDDKYVFCAIISAIVMQPFISILYKHTFLRVVTLIVFACTLSWYVYKHKEFWIPILFRKKYKK